MRGHVGTEAETGFFSLRGDTLKTGAGHASGKTGQHPVIRSTFPASTTYPKIKISGNIFLFTVPTAHGAYGDYENTRGRS